MDLRIKNNNATKSYVITNNCTTRPRVCMKSDTGVPATPISYLPLTTSTTQGLALHAKVNNQSYRALEFRSMSGSATFYSSNANGQGLSSTTALTCSSTSRTEYLTQSSTSRTEYLTRSSTSATSYLTRSSTSGESYLTKSVTDIVFTSIYSAFGYTGSYQYRSEATTYDVKTVRLMTNYGATNSTLRFGTYTWGNVYLQMTYQAGNRVTVGSLTHSYTSNGSVSSIARDESLYSTSMGAVYQIWLGASSSTDYINMTFSSTSNRYDQPDYYHYTNQSMSTYFTQHYAIDTTGTSYLTRSSTYDTIYYTRSSTYDTVYYTRSSTYSTVYHTRSSTSGYSGVSSSSSETSGWQ